MELDFSGCALPKKKISLSKSIPQKYCSHKFSAYNNYVKWFNAGIEMEN